MNVYLSGVPDFTEPNSWEVDFIETFGGPAAFSWATASGDNRLATRSNEQIVLLTIRMRLPINQDNAKVYQNNHLGCQMIWLLFLGCSVVAG
jgi:hypothetical protein